MTQKKTVYKEIVSNLKCGYCKEKIAGHKKCKRCGILLHEKNEKYVCKCGVQHTLIGNKYNYLCSECEDIVLKKGRF